MTDKIDYTPRNTHQDKDGNIRVRGRVVCRSNPHNWSGRGSNFTAKGGERTGPEREPQPIPVMETIDLAEADANAEYASEPPCDSGRMGI